jgi:hypothetical protein
MENLQIQNSGMSEKRLNNTIFLMYLVSENYKKAHNLSSEQFLELDRQYDIINYIGECPDIFDSMSDTEMVEEIDQYVSEINNQYCPD